MNSFEDAIGYIMSKYRGQEDHSMDENCDAVLDLWTAGIECYSPIASTHPVEIRRQLLNQKMCCPKCKKKTDLGILYPAGKNILCHECHFEGPIAVFHKNNLPVPDYIAHDLFLIKRLMKNDSTSLQFDIDDDGFRTQIDYDSGVFGIILPSAIPTTAYLQEAYITDISQIPADVKAESWFSNGVTDEYLFCKANHIMMITKPDVIANPRDRWRDFAV